MDKAHQPQNAFDRARAAYNEMMRRERAVADERRLLAKARNIRIAIASGAIIGLSVGGVIFFDLLPAPARHHDDADFGTTRTGHVRSYVRGNTCQELQFNNTSGTYIGGALVPCETTARKEVPLAGERMNSIRDAFTR